MAVEGRAGESGSCREAGPAVPSCEPDVGRKAQLEAIWLAHPSSPPVTPSDEGPKTWESSLVLPSHPQCLLANGENGPLLRGGRGDGGRELGKDQRKQGPGFLPSRGPSRPQRALSQHLVGQGADFSDADKDAFLDKHWASRRTCSCLISASGAAPLYASLSAPEHC